MKRSTDRILTTHAGRLEGPPDLMQMSRDVMAGRAIDVQQLQPRLRNGIAEVIRKQAEAGIDVISDGLHRHALDLCRRRKIRKALREIHGAILHRLARHFTNYRFSEQTCFIGNAAA